MIIVIIRIKNNKYISNFFLKLATSFDIAVPSLLLDKNIFCDYAYIYTYYYILV